MEVDAEATVEAKEAEVEVPSWNLEVMFQRDVEVELDWQVEMEVEVEAEEEVEVDLEAVFALQDQAIR